MVFITTIWSILLSVFLSVPIIYYFYMRHAALKPWNLRMNTNYEPLVTILIPAHNEEKSIRLKLENLLKLQYPREKIHAVVINDCSTDNTLAEMYTFQQSHSMVRIDVVNNRKRMGKTRSLNNALEKINGEIIVVSDADCFLSPDILEKALPYLSNPTVGAVSGLEVLLNPAPTWVTRTEILYNTTVHTIRVGESKIHSTILFQGGFGAYKRNLLTKFDSHADDSGTALNIVQKHSRTLLVPEARYYTSFPGTWKGKTRIKLRRAEQLMKMWKKGLKLAASGKLVLPKKILLPEAFLYLINPVVFLFLIALTILLFFEFPFLFPAFSVLLLSAILIKKSRTILLEVIQDHFVLLVAIFVSMSNTSSSSWKTLGGKGTLLTRRMLEKENLL